MIIKALLLFLKKGLTRKDEYYEKSIDTIMIAFTFILVVYRGFVVFVMKKEMNSVRKLDVYNRNEKQEKFISSIERKIDSLGSNLNQLNDTSMG